ncbi:MAG: NUDIX domain-containing protein [Bacteroidota bacterium]
MKLIDKLAWIEIVDRKILMTRSKGKSKYYIPGGKREAGESDWQALSREIKEELDVSLEENTMDFVGIFQAQADGQPEGVEVRMTCYSGNYTGTVKPSMEIEEITWMTTADMDRIAPVDILIFNWLKEESLLD